MRDSGLASAGLGPRRSKNNMFALYVYGRASRTMRRLVRMSGWPANISQSCCTCTGTNAEAL